MLGHRRLYEGKVLALDVDEVQEPEGVRAVREVVRHRGSVAALPVLDDGRVVLVRQYRYAVDERVWEIPAGRLDPGETPAEGARRELKRRSASARPPSTPCPSSTPPPASATSASTSSGPAASARVPPRPEEDERIERGTFTLEEARAMIRRGEVRDSKTLLALLLENERRLLART